MENIDLIEKINKLKKEKNAIYVGDSLYLSQIAANFVILIQQQVLKLNNAGSSKISLT